jgi:hypothetical protein
MIVVLDVGKWIGMIINGKMLNLLGAMGNSSLFANME